MTGRKDFDGLAELAALHFRAAQAEMAGILARETRLRQNLAQLIESKQNQAQAPRQSGDAALVAGADIRWNQWVDQRRAIINAELAQVLALKEGSRAKLKKAFGRDRVTQALQANAIAKQMRGRRRREAYES